MVGPQEGEHEEQHHDRGHHDRGHRDRKPRRRPARVFGVGPEPDPRFSMANERTALAWVRTSLGLVAVGLAAAVADDVVARDEVAVQGLLRVVGAVSVVAAAYLAVWSLVHWGRTERAVRLGRPLPPPSGLVVVALVVVGLAVLTLVSLR